MDLQTGPVIAKIIEDLLPDTVMWAPDHLDDIGRAQYCDAWNIILEGGGYRMTDDDGRVIGWLPARNASSVFRFLLRLNLEAETAK
jgi:hypothetical protein